MDVIDLWEWLLLASFFDVEKLIQMTFAVYNKAILLLSFFVVDSIQFNSVPYMVPQRTRLKVILLRNRHGADYSQSCPGQSGVCQMHLGLLCGQDHLAHLPLDMRWDQKEYIIIHYQQAPLNTGLFPAWHTDTLRILWRVFLRQNLFLSETCRVSNMNTVTLIYNQGKTCFKLNSCFWTWLRSYNHHVFFHV